MSGTDIAFDNVKKGFEFTQKNYRKFFNEMLKIIVLSFAVTFALVMILTLLAVGLAGVFSGSAAPMIAGILILIALIFVAAIIGEAIESVVYNAMDKWGKKMNIWGQAKKNLKPIFLYVLAMIVIYGILVILPMMLMLGVSFGSLAYGEENPAVMAGFVVGQLGARLYQMVASIIIAFILQFVMFELIVARMGIIDSIRKSFSIVKKNFIPTIVFDIVTWAISMAVAVVAIVALLILLLILGLIAFALYGIAGDTALWIIALGVLIFIIFILALSALELTVVLPMQYYYWKAVRLTGVKQTKKKK